MKEIAFFVVNIIGKSSRLIHASHVYCLHCTVNQKSKVRLHLGRGPAGIGAQEGQFLSNPKKFSLVQKKDMGLICKKILHLEHAL